MASMRKRGRPPRLTPELQYRIVESIRLGNYVETACAMADVPKRSYYNWMTWGEAGRKPYQGFHRAVMVAGAQAEARAVSILLKHAETEWAALRWYLERRYPEHWGKYRKASRGELASGTISEFLLKDAESRPHLDALMKRAASLERRDDSRRR